MVAEFLDYKAYEGSHFRRKIAQSPRNKMNVYGMTTDLPGYFPFPKVITGMDNVLYTELGLCRCVYAETYLIYGLVQKFLSIKLKNSNYHNNMI